MDANSAFAGEVDLRVHHESGGRLRVESLTPDADDDPQAVAAALLIATAMTTRNAGISYEVATLVAVDTLAGVYGRTSDTEGSDHNGKDL